MVFLLFQDKAEQPSKNSSAFGFCSFFWQVPTSKHSKEQ